MNTNVKTSKTREIEVWVNPKTIIDNWFEVSTYPETGDIKAKLIIEVPGRKVEITESQFDEAFYGGHDCYSSSWSKEIQRAKQKLFGSER